MHCTIKGLRNDIEFPTFIKERLWVATTQHKKSLLMKTLRIKLLGRMVPGIDRIIDVSTFVCSNMY